MSDPLRDVKAIFLAAVEKSTPAERSAYLDEACAGDALMRKRVDALLQAHEAPGEFFGQPAVGTVPTSAEVPGRFISPDELNGADPAGPGAVVGSRIGPYKLLQLLGEGGMGSVYVAEQEEPVRRRVALKIIKAGMDSERIIARFEQERQALAIMDHPNIAKVLDAGTTESGRPYFVMELVKGIPITKYCDQEHLSPKERLDLFIPVCHAVQHAHQKGIIHRDLKPSNVLIALYDGKPVPKVIDFGVAKATAQKLTERTMFTEVGQIVGTLEYMAPEQAELNNLDIDTRADIYSLGVLLYELLTGSPPFSPKQLRTAAFDEMLRIIREVEPQKPSTKLSNSEELPSIAANRKLEPAKLTKLVRGDLDWIVMRCLEKERRRRYETANGLAMDVQRYLADEPVEACPPSARYRLGKFARKYKKALVTVMAFAFLLVSGTVISTLLAFWATSAESEANRQRLASDAAKLKAGDAKVEADRQRDEARVTAYTAGIQLARRAWDENDVVRARELLEEVPKEASGKDLRGFEWYYLFRLCHSEAVTLASEGVRSLTFSPDGQRLAAGHGLPVADGGPCGSVKIWDSATGKVLVSHKVDGFVMAFSPDLQRLASDDGSKTMKIWDSATGKELFALSHDGGAISCMAFSPEGRRLAAGCYGGTAKIWDSVTGKELASLKGDPFQLYGMAFSPDGRRLAAGGGRGTVRMWDSVTGKELFSIKGDADVFTVAFSSDGRHLAAGGISGTVKIWDSATGKELRPLKGHGKAISSVAFSPDGRRLASGSRDNTMKIWDIKTGKELFSLKGHGAWVQKVVFSPDSQRLASASVDETVKIWDIGIGKEFFVINRRDFGGSKDAFSADGRRLASGGWQTLKIYDCAIGEELVSHKVYHGAQAFSPDGLRLAAGSGDGNTVKIWDSATGKELLSIKGHAEAVRHVAFGPDGLRLASGSDDKTAKIWDSATGKELFSLNGHAGTVRDVAFSPDGLRLASGSDDKTVNIWDSATGNILFSLKGHTGRVFAVAFSPDGLRLASGSEDRSVKFWDTVTGKELCSLKGHLDSIYCVAFSPDGRRMASGSADKTVRIWDSDTGKELFALRGPVDPISSVAFSPNGERLASKDLHSIHLWETRVPPELQDRRATQQLVADLFRYVGLRTHVVARLQELPGLSELRRRAAIAAAETHPEDPTELDELAWEQLSLPGRPMADYGKALRYGERACQLEPENRTYLTTLGVAHYRLGNYDKALDTLLRLHEIGQKQRYASSPENLAFLAMTQQCLGRAQEAKGYLQQLRGLLKRGGYVVRNAEPEELLREAEELIEGKLREEMK
jgi:WD40 repeat protein/serine/threonine protein kinase